MKFCFFEVVCVDGEEEVEVVKKFQRKRENVNLDIFGDYCIRFFFFRVKVRLKRNVIIVIKGNLGDWVYEEDEIKRVLI